MLKDSPIVRTNLPIPEWEFEAIRSDSRAHLTHHPLSISSVEHKAFTNYRILLCKIFTSFEEEIQKISLYKFLNSSKEASILLMDTEIYRVIYDFKGGIWRDTFSCFSLASFLETLIRRVPSDYFHPTGDPKEFYISKYVKPLLDGEDVTFDLKDGFLR